MKKAVNLFEVLPGASSANAAKDAQLRSTVEPVGKGPVAPPLPPPSAQSTSSGGNLQSRERHDNLFFVVAILLCLSVLSGLLGYVLGKRHGTEKTSAYFLQLKTSRIVRDAPMVELTQTKPLTAEVGEKQVEQTGKFQIAPVHFPTKIKEPTESQRQVLNPEEARVATIQVHSVGKRNPEAAQGLVAFLKSHGFEAFANNETGVVYAGRYNSHRSPEIKTAKDKIAKLVWKKISLSDCFIQSLPK